MQETIRLLASVRRHLAVLLFALMAAALWTTPVATLVWFFAGLDAGDALAFVGVPLSLLLAAFLLPTMSRMIGARAAA